jgi:hypothetical protein
MAFEIENKIRENLGVNLRADGVDAESQDL